MERLILVNASKSKTAARRLVPVSDNLAAWLDQSARLFGPVNPCKEDSLGNAIGDRIARAATRAGVPRSRMVSGIVKSPIE